MKKSTRPSARTIPTHLRSNFERIVTETYRRAFNDMMYAAAALHPEGSAERTVSEFLVLMGARQRCSARERQ